MQQPADEEKEEAESPLLKYQSIEHKIEEDKMNIMEAKKKDPRKAVGLMWKIHFFVGLLALCFGMMCNGGGRKYITVDPLKASMDCTKLYVNVHSSSPEEEGAMICCTDQLDEWWLVFSYEGFLCNSKIRSIPFSRSITRYPDSWLLPLIPIALRIVIGIFGKLSDQPHPYPRDIWTTTKRLIFVILIFQIRGWGLYVFLNIVENAVLSSSMVANILDIIREAPDVPVGSCWYRPWLKSWQESGENTCYGIPFDFSDHVVLFFSHSFPSMIFEASFCFLIPFLPETSHWKTRTDRDRGDGREVAVLYLLMNTILPKVLLLVFVYLNIITLLAIHGTVAYFHTVGEVVVGYLISLVVQIPVGWIIWAEEWKHIRDLVGFPIHRREHMD